MVNKEQVLDNQQLELISMCERSIHSMDAMSSSHLTLMGLIAVAFSIALGAFLQRRMVAVFLLFFLGLIVYGLRVYQRILTSHTELVINTRRLNAARGVHVMDNKFYEGKIFLPVDGSEPEFDEMGFFGKKFSLNGFPRTLQWINTMLFFLFTAYFFVLVNTWRIIPYARNIFVGTFTFSNFMFSAYNAAWMYVLHIIIKKRIIRRAREKWENELRMPKNIIGWGV